MAHAVRFRAAAERGAKQGKGSESSGWDADLLHQRVGNNVFGDGFKRVLAGDKTDEGEDNRDQEQPARRIEDDLGDRPDCIQGLYRTSDAEDITEFIDAFEEEVLFDAPWYVIEPHDCTHDREKGGPCEVYDGAELENQIVERGDIPDTYRESN